MTNSQIHMQITKSGVLWIYIGTRSLLFAVIANPNNPVVWISLSQRFLETQRAGRLLRQLLSPIGQP